jgi:ribosomal protein L44E
MKKKSVKRSKVNFDNVQIEPAIPPKQCRYCGGSLRPLSHALFDYPKRLILRFRCKSCGKLSINVILNTDTAKNVEEIFDDGNTNQTDAVSGVSDSFH